MMNRITRRGLLKGAAAGAGLVVLAHPQSARAYAQNAKVRFANVGVGGRGNGHLAPASGEELVAICDADRGTIEKVGAKHPGAKRFDDWRKLLDEMAAKIDGVFVATPDHTHFPAAYTAVKLGKHCYCEKPLTHGIWEARALAELVRQKKVATQMGNQHHANEGNRLVVEWVRAGALGTVTEIHSWTNRPIWPQGRERPSYTDPVPATLNWDSWLGVAPQRPYVAAWREAEYAKERKDVYHPFSWRGWYDFGCGAVGDMGCHTWDNVWWAMDPRAPLSCEPVKVVGKSREMFPRQMIVKWEFGPSAADSPYKRPGFVAYWYEGGLMPPVPEEIISDPTRQKKELPKSGCLFVGTKGKLLSSGDYSESVRIIPESKMDEFKQHMPEKTIPRSPGHHQEFIMACRGEKPWDYPASNFTYGGPLVEAMNLANIAARLGKKIAWDPVGMKCPGTPEADALIKREYRKGFWQPA
ncbi:MAG: Gfo/Idh/MocA family oxidoreductase [Planctomycetes bacterium]|nr:Gfo/Idh/MocA family oxidoreductase [Planctomycetota bacterium]